LTSLSQDALIWGEVQIEVVIRSEPPLCRWAFVGATVPQIRCNSLVLEALNMLWNGDDSLGCPLF
jgi:hypothetical protein